MFSRVADRNLRCGITVLPDDFIRRDAINFGTLENHRTLRQLALILLCLLGFGAFQVEAEEIYLHQKFTNLKLEEIKSDRKADESVVDPRWMIQDVRVPHVVLDGPGEAYLDSREDGERFVYFRVPDRAVISGRLFTSDVAGKGMRAYRFTFNPSGLAVDPESKKFFWSAQWHHYDHLLSMNLPGTAWFRHQKREGAVTSGWEEPGPRSANAPIRAGSNLDPTFDFFSGNRALDENLQLNRTFEMAGARPNPNRPSQPVSTESIRGITIAEMDWSKRLEVKNPQLDPLASQIPADQHAVFFPSLRAASGLLTQFQGDAAPVLRLFDARSLDRRDQTRYERQLGVSIAELGKFPGLDSIRTVAVTGSDPYLPEGTDLAILFETDSSGDLTNFLKTKLDEARKATPEAIDAGGELDGKRYSGIRTPDRSLCSYVGTLGKVVLITNSLAQLKRLNETALGKTPSLAGQPEYRFFRDRYPIGVGAESAFLVLTDATIRRWCGPRWRIGESRRVRASVDLAEAQAANLRVIASGSTTGVKPVAPLASIELGSLQLGRSGVQSETYGTLNFLTPIIELPLDQVSSDEADSYGRWRDSYQGNWRGIFDPIALRLSVQPGKVAADLSVMPLIASSTYQPYIDVIGNARLDPGAGDPHPGTLAHAVMAIDTRSRLVGQGRSLIASFLELEPDVALGWLGRSAGFYLDDDPFWMQLMTARNTSEFFAQNGHRTPVGVTFEVIDGPKLTRFLDGVSRLIQKGMFASWKDLEYHGTRYARISEPESTPPAKSPQGSLYLYGSPRMLTFSLNEDLIKRAMDRDQAKARPAAEAAPWLGEGVALRANRLGFEVMGNSARVEELEAFRARSWANLPILNEWKRLFPNRDPVGLHEELWGVTLVDPCGGRYVWNDRWATMESTVFGHPGEPKTGPDKFDPASRFRMASFGLHFEDHGLRARTEIELTPKP